MFPIYRKYSNNKSYFKVFDTTSFEEIQVLGSNYWIYSFTAKILPDRNFIKDMIDMQGGGWIEISEEVYKAFKANCEKEFKKQI